MNCSPTLTAEDFKQVHNGLCRLAAAIGAVEDVIHPDLLRDLLRAQTEISAGLKGAYDQDNEAFDTKNDHYNEVRSTNGFQSVWSMYEVDLIDDQHTYGDVIQLVYRDHWGPNGPVIVEVAGGTWFDLYEAADQAIRESGDEHHIYIEAFRVNPECPEQLILSTGS